MQQVGLFAVRVGALFCAAVLLGACALVTPSRTVWASMKLAPGQSAVGRIEVPDGGGGFVEFSTWPPEFAGPDSPAPGAIVWRGNPNVLFTFPDAPPGSPGEGRLGYASCGLADGHVCRVIVRNTDAEPATFRWSVISPSDAFVSWDLAAPAGAR